MTIMQRMRIGFLEATETLGEIRDVAAQDPFFELLKPANFPNTIRSIPEAVKEICGCFERDPFFRLLNLTMGRAAVAIAGLVLSSITALAATPYITAGGFYDDDAAVKTGMRLLAVAIAGIATTVLAVGTSCAFGARQNPNEPAIDPPI